MTALQARYRDHGGPKGLVRDDELGHCCSLGMNVRTASGRISGLMVCGVGATEDEAIGRAFSRMYEVKRGIVSLGRSRPGP